MPQNKTCKSGAIISGTIFPIAARISSDVGWRCTIYTLPKNVVPSADSFLILDLGGLMPF